MASSRSGTALFLGAIDITNRQLWKRLYARAVAEDEGTTQLCMENADIRVGIAIYTLLNRSCDMHVHLVLTVTLS